MMNDRLLAHHFWQAQHLLGPQLQVEEEEGEQVRHAPKRWSSTQALRMFIHVRYSSSTMTDLYLRKLV